MSFSRTIAFVNVLDTRRDGRALGATRLASMCAAFDILPAVTQARIGERTATHEFEKFWEMMRARPPYTHQ